MAFCITVPVMILIGGMFLGPLEGHAFFSPRDAMLFLISILVGLIAGFFAGI
jgi:hypothetical protein